MNDTYNLHRFLTAQADTYDTVLAELRAGRKSSHWIWFIFPQIAGLNRRDQERARSVLSNLVTMPHTRGIRDHRRNRIGPQAVQKGRLARPQRAKR